MHNVNVDNIRRRDWIMLRPSARLQAHTVTPSRTRRVLGEPLNHVFSMSSMTTVQAEGGASCKRERLGGGGGGGTLKVSFCQYVLTLSIAK